MARRRGTAAAPACTVRAGPRRGRRSRRFRSVDETHLAGRAAPVVAHRCQSLTQPGQRRLRRDRVTFPEGQQILAGKIFQDRDVRGVIGAVAIEQVDLRNRYTITVASSSRVSRHTPFVVPPASRAISLILRSLPRAARIAAARSSLATFLGAIRLPFPSYRAGTILSPGSRNPGVLARPAGMARAGQA